MKKQVLILALATTVYGQESMSLKDAVGLAMQKSKVIEASGASNDAASARIRQARSGLLPKVNYSESWTRSDNPVSSNFSQPQSHQKHNNPGR